MVQDMAVGSNRRQELAAKVLPSSEWGEFLNQSSDLAGFQQLCFHAGCALFAAYAIHCSFLSGSVKGVVLGEAMLGFVSSFYFMAYHEFIHNTAFRTKWLNKALSSVLGVFIFRGANWFWCFHWLHHRYTQDPDKDPELSGGSSDLADPSRSILMYSRFLTGWPFGFERILGMAKMAYGSRVDPWVEAAGMEKTVRIEAAFHVLIYAALGVGSIYSSALRDFIIWYWLLPHMIGAGHLRWYQFAEHRACESGNYTDLDAWGAARTTSTWFLYRRLAWNMPFHIEHHAWPAIPFHLLPDVHERIKDSQPQNRCLISGERGYVGIHIDFLRRMLKGEPTSLPPLEALEQVASEAGSVRTDAAQNRLGDASFVDSLPRFSLAEVQKHSSQSDCWVIVGGIIIDPTDFLSKHPGGEMVILNQGGKDASKMFKMIHPEGTLERHLPASCIIGLLSDVSSSGNGLAQPLLNAK